MVGVADPDPAVREGMCALLESCGLPVRSYEDARSLLGEDAETPPPCLVLDLELTGLGPREALPRLRRLGRGTTLIVVASCPDARFMQDLLRAGVREVLEKPFPPDALISAVKGALARSARAGG